MNYHDPPDAAPATATLNVMTLGNITSTENFVGAAGLAIASA